MQLKRPSFARWPLFHPYPFKSTQTQRSKVMENCYLVNGEKLNWIELIEFAEDLDADFSETKIKTTSEAAQILRKFGHTVENFKG